MTVCIAAACNNMSGRPAIVACTDWKTGSSLGSAETHFKQRILRPGWYALTSGYESDIRALARHYGQHLSSLDSITDVNVAEALRAPLKQRKLEKADEFVTGKYGISYDDFLKFGKDQFPPDIFRDALIQIANIKLRAEFVLAGFVNGFGWLAETDGDGKLFLKEDFAVAGEAGYLATSVLLHRKQNDMTPLNETLYNVYEAKKYAERVPSVGEQTALVVWYPDGKRHAVNNPGHAALRDMFRQYGPKTIDQEIIFDPKFLDDV